MKSQSILFRSIITLATSFTLFSCSTPIEENISPNTFSGKITNGEVDTVYLYNTDNQIKLAVDSGNFSDTIELSEGYYTLRIGRETTTMYWDSAFQIGLSIDLKEFDESVEYSGYGAAENNTLAKTYLLIEEKTGKELFIKEEEAFLIDLKEFHELLKGLSAGPHGSKRFQEEHQQSADFYFNSYLFSYPSYHRYYAKLDSFNVSDEFYNNAMPFDKELEELYDRSSSYREMLNSYTQHRINITRGEAGFVETLSNVLEEFNSKKIRGSILSGYTYQLLKPSEELELSYNLLENNTSDTAKLNQYAKAYESLKKIAKGMPSPEFTDYENHAGGTTSLADLKGKYLYIDVWATWCGPCIREIPSLKELEHEYEGDQITFVSISIDKKEDHETWVDMVNDKELGGIQLFADNAWRSEFVEKYYIKGIPRFIIIDHTGNIISADAPRPSDPELKEVIDNLLKPIS